MRESSERRSTTRPRVVENWRKPIVSRPAAGLRGSAATAPRRVEVWVASTASLLRANSAFTLLSDQDTAFLARHKIDAARNGALVARILLRLGLSQAVSRRVAPSEWRFERTPYGKPLVASQFPDVRFSLSHADEVVVVAFAEGLNVGVDVETIDQDIGPEVAAAFSHSEERAALGAVPQSRRSREFLRFWTQKEAYTKLVGHGHSIDFSTIDCSRGAQRLASANDAGGAPHIENFFVSIGHVLYHVSLAVEGAKEGRIDLQIVNVFGPEGTEEADISPICGSQI